MITYTQEINGQSYWYFYDRSIRSWTVLKVDAEGNQEGEAEHYEHKNSLLKDYNFNFKNKLNEN